jgi:hypothetical protein
VCVARAVSRTAALCRNFALSLRVHRRKSASGTSGSCHDALRRCQPRMLALTGHAMCVPTIDSGPCDPYGRINVRPTVDRISVRP